ncbi:MAG: lytic transglycosylase domain-containing protein [Gammaproteobacteria bacterium]|nr:MAG: lytic transglycosylase domain-containing protein [Gammaproteobacteria bacterium]
MRYAWALIAIFYLVSVRAAQQQPPDAQFQVLLKQTIAKASSFRDRFDAQVWLTDMSTRLAKYAASIPLKERMLMLRTVHREATRHGLDPHLILAVMDVESRFDRFAVSRAGARGLMQVMPFWKQVFGRSNDNLFDIETNIYYGCTILATYLAQENGDIYRALARYNGSLGQHKYPRKVMKHLRARWYRR